MAHNLILRRKGQTLVPDDAMGFDALARIPEGQAVKAVITVPRNVGHHRMLFALLKVVLDGQCEPAQFSTTEGLLDALKMATGHVREVKDLSGNTFYIPASIDFSSMGQDSFKEWFDRAVEVILLRVLPQCDKAEIEQQIFDILGEPGPAQLRRA